MRQALHIFKKDVRSLRYEIVVTLLTVVAFILNQVPRTNRLLPSHLTSWAGTMLPIAGWILITRAIHAETLPGDWQFWRTRPYDRKSLLGAKILFILAFVNLPKLIADAIIVHAYGFPMGSQVPGLLWSQVLLTGVFALPIAALATMTAGFASLAIATFIAIVAALLVFGISMGPLDWIPYSVATAFLASAATMVVLLQYTLRRTWIARGLAVSGGLLMTYGSLSIQPATALALQSRLSKIQVSPSALHVEFDEQKRSKIRVRDAGDVALLELPVPAVEVPGGLEVRIDGLSVRLVAPDGGVWPSNQHPAAFIYPSESSIQFNVDTVFYQRVKDGPVALRGSAYLTLLGNRKAVQLGRELALVPGAGACRTEMNSIECQYPFRSPPLIISSPDGWSEPVRNVISYSPFPAELGVSPFGLLYIQPRKPSSTPTNVTLVTEEPLAHLGREFEIDGLRLADFEVKPKQ